MFNPLISDCYLKSILWCARLALVFMVVLPGWFRNYFYVAKEDTIFVIVNTEKTYK
jgi:hypothetical protein